MKIVIIGAGGVGGYYGARLMRAGYDVTFQARGAHFEALRTRGLEVRACTGTFTLSVSVTEDASTVAGAELVILAVKSYSLTAVGAPVRSLAERGSVVLPLVSGIDIAERCLAFGVPRDSLLGGVTTLNTVKVAPGVIVQEHPEERIMLGEFDGTRSPRAHRIAALFRAAGVEAIISSSITLALWRQFAAVASCAALCGFAHGDHNAVSYHPYGADLLRAAIREVGAIARAYDIPFTRVMEEEMCVTKRGWPEGRIPGCVTYLDRGGMTEIDALSGTISRLGRQVGVATPVHDVATLLFSNQLSPVL